MTLKPEIFRLLAVWGIKEEGLIKFWNQLPKPVVGVARPEAIVGMLLLLLALAKEHGLSESQVKLMMGQFTKEIYK